MERKTTELRQEEIKKAVLEIIHTDGLKSLSTRNLAKKINISEGAIFRHFPTKQAIILSIIEEVKTDFIGQLEKIANTKKPAPQKIEKLLCATVNYLISNKGITMLLFSEASYENDNTLKEQLQYIFNRQRQLVCNIVNDGIKEGIWDSGISTEYFATLYMGIPVSLNIELILKGKEFYADNFCKEMISILFKILNK